MLPIFIFIFLNSGEKNPALQNMNFYLVSKWGHFGFVGFTLGFLIRIYNPMIF
jgi:hypothetical protein